MFFRRKISSAKWFYFCRVIVHVVSAFSKDFCGIRKRATNYRALLRKMAYKDKATYDSTPSCNNFFCRVYLLVRSHSTCCFCILKRLLWNFFNTCSLRQVQPVSKEIGLEMVIGIQNRILNSQSSCFFFKQAL